MKNAAIAFLLSVGICLFALLVHAAGRRQARLEDLIARLDGRGRAVEAELERLKSSQAGVVPVLRDCARRGELLEERVHALEEKIKRAPLSGGTAASAVTHEELDEVVTAVNELVEVVDGLSAKVEASSQSQVALNAASVLITEFSGDGSRLVYDLGGRRNTVRLWDAASGAARLAAGQVLTGDEASFAFEDVSRAAAADPDAGAEEAEVQPENDPQGTGTPE